MTLTLHPCDVFDGCVVRVGDPPQAALIVGADTRLLGSELLHQGKLVVAYGLALLYELDFLLPQWVHDDFRREYHGADALDFTLRKGDAFPRADVVGRRVSTGERAELFLKQLDLARGAQAFAYASFDAPTPFARLDAALWVDADVPGFSALPAGDARATEWLRKAVPCFIGPPASLEQLAAHLSAV